MSVKAHILQEKSRIPELIELFATGLGTTKKLYWEWRLFSGLGEWNPVAVVAENEQGRLDGMMTAIPVMYGERKLKMLQLCDWVVRPEVRGQGLISKMFGFLTEAYRQQDFDGLMGFPNEQSKPVLTKYQFDHYAAFSSWSTAYRPFYEKRTSEEVWKKETRFLFTETCPSMTVPMRSVRLYRDTAYLEWKYDKNPETRYSWLSIWHDSRCLGYFVYTLTKGRVRTVLNVYDWEFDAQYPTEFAQAIDLLRKQGNSVCIWGKYSEREEFLLQKAKMKKSELGQPLMVKPFDGKTILNDLVITRVDTDF
jgi:GNAT superfamily N-acetyltransferase